MRRLRVCIYGGTNLHNQAQHLISRIAYKLVERMSAVIVTGGFLRSQEEPNAISTDVAALRGAQSYCADNAQDLHECFEAWIPEPVLDKRPDVKPVRMSEENGITIRVINGRTPLGRRLSMVAGVDMLLTISGKRHTEVVVEQALELGIPVLPIPDFGGDSAELFRKYPERIAAAFDRTALHACLSAITQSAEDFPETAAEKVIDLLQTAKVGKCLILLPYDDEHKDLYETMIEPAVVKYMIPIRLDRLPQSGAIYNSFADAIRSSNGVIADITRLNENVMYEIGFAHGQGLTPLIYSREVSRLGQLPVYFRTLNVRLASNETPLDALISDYLVSLRATRGIRPSSI